MFRVFLFVFSFCLFGCFKAEVVKTDRHIKTYKNGLLKSIKFPDNSIYEFKEQKLIKIIRPLKDKKVFYYWLKDVYFFKNGKLHRKNGPAVTINHIKGDCIYLEERWYFRGRLHRKEKPAVVFSNGDMYWYKKGLLHREDGPAVILPTQYVKMWYEKGLLHREDGPAIINLHHREWWLNGVKYSKKQFDIIKKRIKK